MLVGDEDQVGLGEGRVVRNLAVGIDGDGHSVAGKQQTSVPEKGDGEVAGGGRDDVPLLLLRPEDRRRQQEQSDQGSERQSLHKASMVRD